MDGYKLFLADANANVRYLKKIRAKRRFRAIVRLVIANLYWMEEAEAESMGDNVAKNVRMITRRKRGARAAIDMRDRIIMRKRVEARTIEEKNRLGSAFGNVRCFQRYPEQVRKGLAAVTFYEYYGPGRVIVKQGHDPYGMYFLLSGQADVTHTVYNPVIEMDEEVVLNILEPGAMFGELSLLHNTRRLATITTKGHCQFLRVKKVDFEKILKTTVKDEWVKMQEAIKLFEYFKKWNDDTITEFCVIAKRSSYKHNETVLGDGIGYATHAYFIVKGKCRLIQHLYLRPYYKNGLKRYQLFEPEQLTMPKPDIKSKECIACIPSTISTTASDISTRSTISTNYSTTTTSKKAFDLRSYIQSPSYVSIDADLIPKDVETHFMEMCIFYQFSCFNVGETFRHRRIVAVNNVEILSVPLYFLMQNNMNNMWNKIKATLNQRIPDTVDLYKAFLRQRAWEAEKKKMFETIQRTTKIHRSDNNIHNVPYSIRLKQEPK